MSWTRYLCHDYFTRKELDRIDDNVRRVRMASARSDASLRDRVAELEDDLGRLTLFTHALAEACVRKGVFSREEIAAIADELDLLDGCADGRLDPAALRGPEEQRPPSRQSPEDHLQQLEKGEQQTPGKFLSELEDRDRS